MYPKLKIEVGTLNIHGVCIQEIPYSYGVQWQENGDGFQNGNHYKFKVNVNGEKGEITFSDEILNTLSNKTFNELLIPQLNFSTGIQEFNIILKDVYQNWLEMSKVAPL